MFFRLVTLFLIIMLTVSLFTGCTQLTASGDSGPSAFSTYRDIPGLTQELIDEIAELRNTNDHFIYAMPLSTEAFINEQGDLRGFTALFAQWLTDFFDIEFKPQLTLWQDVLSGLETGDIPFSGELTPTDARKEIYEMTEPIAMRPLKTFRLVSSEPINEIIETRLLNTGFIRGTATINAVTSRMPYGTYNIVELESFDHVYDALNDGTIDAFYYSGVAEVNFVEHSDIVSDEFFPLIFMPVSLMTQTPHLAPIIEIVDKALEFTNIRRHIADLYKFGYQEYLRHKLFVQLTDEERNFINEHPVIPFAAENDNYPLSFFNARDEEWQGISIDVLREIEILTGLHFERVNNEDDNFADMLRMIGEGKAAFITELMFTEQRAYEYLWTDTSLLTARSSLISKEDHRDIKLNDVLHMNVGVIEGYAHTEYFWTWFPNHPGVFEYANLLDAFDALDRGDIDTVMVGDIGLLILTNFSERSGYKIIYLFDNPYSAAFGINKNEEILHSVMNKAMRLIDIEMITEHWLRRTYDYQVKILEAQRPWIYASFAALFFIIIFITIVYINGIKLTRQRTEAEMANKTKTTFLATMSHEIRTPMNSIVGFSELALDDDISPKTKGYLTNILDNSEGLLQIINDILDISKIESGNMELEHVPFDPRDLLHACHTIISPKANEKGLELDFSVETLKGKLPLGDPTRLRQVFVNLLSNAVKFTSSGSVKFHISVINLTEDKATIYVEIKDTGIGMTENQIKEVFTPFKQAESETTRKYGGTGLGLAITKNLLEMMGTQLHVESVHSIGSKFYFEITFDTIDIPEEGKYKTQVIQSQLQKPLFKGEVLLCEDNAMNRQVICEHLARVGLKTVVAENGNIGVELVRNRLYENKKQFDLIFMDMHMPEMDGVEASAVINEMNLGIPIVAMTANMMTGDRELYETSGMSGYVGKPFTSQELWRCLLKFFKPVNWQDDLSLDEQADNDLRQRLIRRFVAGNTNKYNEITEAIKSNDITTAHRLAHTLKSNAGQLNKTELQYASSEIERNLKDGNNLVTPQQLRTLETELSAVLEEYTSLIDEEDNKYKSSVSEPLDTSAIMETLGIVEHLLKDHDPECLSFTDTLRLIPGCYDIIKLMENFDFDLALQAVIDVKSIYGELR